MMEIRKYRICDIAIFDLVTALVGTVLAALLLQKYKYPTIAPEIFAGFAIILAIPIGIVVHMMLGINTTLNYKLGLSAKS